MRHHHYIAVLVMAFTLTACGGSSNKNNNSTGSSSVVNSAAASVVSSAAVSSVAATSVASSALSSAVLSSTISSNVASSNAISSSVVSSSSVSSSGVVSSSSISSISSSNASSSSSSSSNSSVRVATGWLCPTSGLYFCDDFESNNTDKWDLKPTTANTLVPDGAFDIADDNGNYALRYTAAASGGVIALVKPSALTGVNSADYFVEAKIRPRINSTTSNKQIYLIARYQDGNNFYAAALNVQSTTASTQVEIAKMKAGSISRPKQVKKPITMGAVGALDGQWYSLRLELIGSTLTVYLDGENLGSVTDADFTSQGLIGLWTANKSFEIDDIKVGDANQKPASLLLSPVESSYAAEVGDAARLITVTAKTDMGVDDSFTIVSDNPAVVSAVKTGNSVSLNPLSAGTATITFTSISKPDLRRTVVATIAPAFVMPTATYNLSGLVTPAAAATSTYEDQVLKLTFDAAPTLGTSGSVRIFKVSDDSLVDTIKLTGESDAIGFGTLRTINTRPIRISANTASISLHSNKLALGTAYYVAVSGSVFTGTTLAGQVFTGIGKNTGWTFTTRASAPNAGLTALTVDDTGNTADFRTLQSALNYVMQNVALDTPATITLKDGVYEEPLYLRNKNNLTIVGESRAGAVIQYPNNEALNSGSSGRPVFLVETADLLTLDTLTLKNTTLIGAGAQAEAIYFNSPSGRLIAKNANFISEQDTLQLQGWNWFYQSLIAGNVDFIWGGSSAALFEQSEIRTLGRSTGNANGGYVVQARVKAATDKGFVFLNSSLTGGAGPSGDSPVDGTHYLARSPGGTTTFDNVVFINTKIGKHINDIGWAGSGINAQPASNPGTGMATVGWREYASMDVNGTTLDISKRQFGFQLSLGDISTNFCNRAQIFAAFNSNAGWNPLPSDTTDCINVTANSSSSASSAPASSSSSSSSVAASSSSSSSVTSSTSSSAVVSSSSVSSSSSSAASSSAPSTTTTTFIPTYAALSAAVVSSPAANANANFNATATPVSVAGLNYYSASAGGLRLFYDATGTSYSINYNGSAFKTDVVMVEGTSGQVNPLGLNTAGGVTRYVSVPFAASASPVTLKVSFSNSATTCVNGQIAIVDQNSKTWKVASACGTGTTTLSVTLTDSSVTELFVLMNRNGDSGGGIRIWNLELTK